MTDAGAIVDAKITEMWQEGLYPKEIGEAINLEPNEVLRRATEMGLSSPDAQPRRLNNEWTPDRVALFTEMWNNGAHVSDLMEEFGLERASVYARRQKLDLPTRRQGRKLSIQKRGNGAKTASDGQRRFKPSKAAILKDPAGPLPEWHPAVRNGATKYGGQVTPARHMERLLKSGEHNRKIGSICTKGRWKGMPIYTLTLEERATCLRTCEVWAECYGNAMGQAQRIHDDGWLTTKLWLELELLSLQHPQGFIIRLHVLGDFYSTEYVKFWDDAAYHFGQLHIFGFTARMPDTEIGEALVHLMNDHLDQVAMRWSGLKQELHGSEVIRREEDAIGIICPAQKDTERCCATCALCWNSERTISFLEH